MDLIINFISWVGFKYFISEKDKVFIEGWDYSFMVLVIIFFLRYRINGYIIN